MAIVTRTTKKKGTTYTPRVKDPNGKWYPTETFERKVDALKFERELLRKKDSGQSVQSSTLRNLSINSYWDQWSKECRSDVSMGWQQSQDQMFRKHIRPYIGLKKLIEIKTRDIHTVLNTMIEANLSDQTRLHVYNLLHRMFECGVHHFEFIEFNPVKKKMRPSVKAVERNFLSVDQSSILLEAVRDHWLGPPVWLGILAGLRPCETQALTWEAIDFEKERIVIKAAYQRKEKKLQPYPKQGDWGQVPLMTNLESYLRRLSPTKVPSEFVAPNSQGGMLNYDSFRRALKVMCRDLGLTEVTPHELRHSATDILYEAGASPEDIRRFLNHKSLSATRKYIHHTDRRLAEVMGNAGRKLTLVKPNSESVSQKFHKN